MRIVTWNCNGVFRKKWQQIAALGVDIAVIQECENPSHSKDLFYSNWTTNHLWVGQNKNKGLGVFASPGISLIPVPLDFQPLELFLPCLVDGEWPLLAVWTRQANSPNFRYIGQLWKFLQMQREFLRHPNAMVVGDLNSNAKWDEWDRWWNHSDVARELSELGLESCYHRHFSEAPGAESRNTFFMHRNVAKPYHIDYGFAGPQWTVRTVEVGGVDAWLEHSDHMPIIFEFERVQHAEPRTSA